MRNRHRRGFTLVELLVVIGIIALLIGILIPTVNKVRQSVHVANTKAMMQKITAACSAYQLSFNAYPGLMPNSAYPGGVGSQFADPSYQNFTQSEDLVVTLAGGLALNAGKFSFDPNYLGQGPTNFNPLNPGKAHSAFISADPNDLPPKDNTTFYQISKQAELNQPFVQDSPAPEFMDKFPEPRPIIYVRANRGAKSLANGASILSPGPTDPNFASCHYNFGAVAPYLNTGDTAETLAGGPAKPEVITYFTSEQSTTSAKFAGTYILISAGPDHKFGTADDVVMGGGGGQ